MSTVASKALEEHLGEPEEGESEDGDSEESPAREVLREAWQAVKGNDFEAFADAVESLVEIKMAEG